MTPMLNPLSLFEAAQSFQDRDGNPDRLAGDFFVKVFGESGRAFVDDYHLFEVITEADAAISPEVDRFWWNARRPSQTNIETFEMRLPANWWSEISSTNYPAQFDADRDDMNNGELTGFDEVARRLACAQMRTIPLNRIKETWVRFCQKKDDFAVSIRIGVHLERT
jgi:hypothetical protein